MFSSSPPESSSSSSAAAAAAAASHRHQIPASREESPAAASERKRRLTNSSENVWPRRPRPSTRTVMIESSSPLAASTSMEESVGSTSSNPIDLASSSPPAARGGSNTQMYNSSSGSSNTQMYNSHMDYTLPPWQPDSEVSECPICRTAFSFWYRKHHCRKCGRVVCAACSPHRITIPRQFIVRPPDQPCPSYPVAAGRTTAGVAQVIDLTMDNHGGDAAAAVAATAHPSSFSSSSSSSVTLLNPALGGGEEVRLCNPCVPDPNPDPPRRYPAARTSEEGVLTATGWPSTPYGLAPNQPRHRPYHSVSSIHHSDVHPGRRTVGSNDYLGYGGFGNAYGPIRFHPSSSMSLATATTSTPSSLPARHGEARPPWFFSGSEPEVPSRSRHHHVPRGPPVDERDLCPVCNRALPPRSQDGSEEAREAHIRECIVSHGSRVRSPSSRSDSSGGGLLPVSSRPPSPLRMVTFTATEKDCLGQEGSAAECTICMEEYEVGQPLVRLECLCKFHRRCIVEWFERKEECPVHKVSY